MLGKVGGEPCSHADKIRVGERDGGNERGECVCVRVCVVVRNCVCVGVGVCKAPSTHEMAE